MVTSIQTCDGVWPNMIRGRILTDQIRKNIDIIGHNIYYIQFLGSCFNKIINVPQFDFQLVFVALRIVTKDIKGKWN